MKRLWTTLKPIICCYLIQYIAVIIAIVLYLLLTNNDQIEYDLVYKYVIIGITITIIPICLYIIKKYRRKESKIELKKLFLTIPLGFGISWLYNMLTISFQESTELMNLHIIVIILYTVILGPIFEELVFRYLALNKASKIYSKKRALIIISLVFAFLHTGIINIIYAFIIGMVLGWVYQKEENIIYPIAIHVSANLASIFVTEYNTIILIISIVLLMFVYYKKQLTN